MTAVREEVSLEERLDDWMGQSFALVQRLLITAVAIALVILSVMALWNTFVLVQRETDVHDLTRAITIGIDAIFLTVILLELLHTVISRVPLAQQAPDFIIIGITSAIRHGLGLVATTSAETVTRRIGKHIYQITVPGTGNPRDIVINLVINSGSVLLLVAALWLVRHRVGGEQRAVEATS
jgi:spore maturation protein SpmA